MPARRIHSFILTTIGVQQQTDPSPWTVFEWTGSGDNTDMIDWAEAFRPGQLDASIDDSGDPDVFSWEQTANGSATGSFDLVAGRYLRLWKTPGMLGEPVHVEFFDGVPEGRWVSDEYGRPLDLNDLQAP